MTRAHDVAGELSPAGFDAGAGATSPAPAMEVVVGTLAELDRFQLFPESWFEGLDSLQTEALHLASGDAAAVVAIRSALVSHVDAQAASGVAGEELAQAVSIE